MVGLIILVGAFSGIYAMFGGFGVFIGLTLLFIAGSK